MILWCTIQVTTDLLEITKIVSVAPAWPLALMENCVVNCKLDYSSLTVLLQYLVLCHLVLLTTSSVSCFAVFLFLGCMHMHITCRRRNDSDYLAEKMLVCVGETNSEMLVRRNGVGMCPRLNSLELKCMYTYGVKATISLWPLYSKNYLDSRHAARVKPQWKPWCWSAIYSS